MACKDGKHKFKPRYTLIYSSLMEEMMEKARLSGAKFDISGMPWQAGERTLKEKRYIHDVCIRCGETVKNG